MLPVAAVELSYPIVPVIPVITDYLALQGATPGPNMAEHPSMFMNSR